MKRMLFLLFSVCYGVMAFAQDIIVLKSGEAIEALIQEITIDIIKYKRYNNPEGPTFTLFKSEVFMIKYANGDQDIFKTEPARKIPASFTGGQRLGTWMLNSFTLPGLGSYLIMYDWAGGSVMLGLSVLGYTLTGIGYYTIFNASTPVENGEWHTDDDKMTTGFIMLGIGAAVLISESIYNIVRSATYNKPIPKAVKGFDPRALGIAILPGKAGVEKVALSYTIQF